MFESCRGRVSVISYGRSDVPGSSVMLPTSKISRYLLLASSAAVIGSALPSQATACAAVDLGSGMVREVIDARTLRLDEGREVRLADILTPTDPAAKPATEQDAVSAAWEQRAKDDLAARVAGKTVMLRGAQPAPDRYGRLRAYVFVADERVAAAIGTPAGMEGAVQESLVRAGLARMAASLADASCADGLRRAERQAVAGRIGIWADPVYAVKNAGEPASVLAVRGQLALVEGQVLSVRPSGGTIYVNFGRRWSEDFTVTIAKRHERMMTAAGKAPKAFEKRRVRVRGYVGERGGPWIEVTRPEQIEIVGSN